MLRDSVQHLIACTARVLHGIFQKANEYENTGRIHGDTVLFAMYSPA